ncbi:hypothetical protein BT69DRAFT_257053 [Atractiella rhizophila]|nr:hypothetical protein BT69DRAFT_257053 [Atractiella rhizophila]
MDRSYGSTTNQQPRPQPLPAVARQPIDPLARRGIRQEVYLVGARGAGKTSVFNRVFKAMEPREALFLRPSRESQIYDFSAFTDVRLIDYRAPQQPGERLKPFEGLEFRNLSSLIVVFDIRADRQYALMKDIAYAFVKAFQANPSIHLHMFLHKADDKSDVTKAEENTEIQNMIRTAIDDISNLSNDRELRRLLSLIQFHLTSVYDTTVHAAFSKVVERLIPQRVALQRLLDIFVSNSQLLRAFIFNTTYNLFVATDTTSPFDTLTYDMLMQYLLLLHGFRQRVLGPLKLSQHQFQPL